MSFAQSPANANSSAQLNEGDLAQPLRSFKPKLPLQAGLKIAEDYVRKNHIEITNYWLYQAKYIVYGKKDKDPQTRAWFFWWVNNREALGNYVTIVVFMDGQAQRTPSM